MNSQNAAKYLPLIKALSEGKTLQINSYGKQWLDVDDHVDLMKEPSIYRIKPERKTITGFVNVYSDSPSYSSSFCATKKQADEMASKKRIACVLVDITYEEGEGLS